MSANKLSKHIVVLPYNPDWPKIFKAESQKIKLEPFIKVKPYLTNQWEKNISQIKSAS